MPTNKILSRDSIIQQAIIAARLNTTTRRSTTTYAATAESMYDEILRNEIYIYPYRWASTTQILEAEMVPRMVLNKDGILVPAMEIDPTKRVAGKPDSEQIMRVVMQRKPSNYYPEAINERVDAGQYVVYTEPADAIRLIGIWYRGTNDQVEYFADDDGVHAPNGDLIVRYSRLPSTTEAVETRFPFPFARVLEVSIAYRLSQIYDSENKGNLDNELRDARQAATTADESGRGGNVLLFDTTIFTDPRRFSFYGSTNNFDSRY